MHPRTPCPEGAAEAWRAGPACQPLHLPLVSQIRLVAHQHDDDVAAPLCPDIINPLRGLLEGVEVWRLKVRIKLGVRSSSWRERGKVGKRQETGGNRDVRHAPLDTEEGHGACTLRHPGRMWSVHPQTPRRGRNAGQTDQWVWAFHRRPTCVCGAAAWGPGEPLALLSHPLEEKSHPIWKVTVMISQMD